MLLDEILCGQNRSKEGGDLLRTYAWLDFNILYNLACYECLSGNTEEAKRLIAEYLSLHSEKKDQALADSDFSAIKDYIASL
jgi:hypothetical protein